MNDESKVVRLVGPVEDGEHVLGQPTAAATLVEYGDYECRYCRQLHPLLRELMKRTEGLRFVYRHFPINKVHPHALRAAEAAEAAATQGRFWEMHDALFEQDPPLDDERLARCAGKAGLDMERYTREMAEGVYAEKVDKALMAASFGGGVTGTPTLYLNGVRRSDIHGLEALLAAVAAAGATVQESSHWRTNWLNRLRKFRPGAARPRLL